MKKFAPAAGLCLAAVVLGGCVAFDGPIQGTQVQDDTVQLKFVLCNDGPEDSCQNNSLNARRGAGESRVLLAFRMPEDTEVPEQIEVGNADVTFVPSPSYSAQLNKKAPGFDGAKWFGYISDPLVGEDEIRGKFSLRFGLPDHPGSVFRYRPIVGYQDGAPAAKVRCADDVTDGVTSGGTQFLCSDDPDDEDDIAKNLKIPLS